MGDSALARTTVRPVREDLYFSTERPSDSWKLEIWDQWELSSREWLAVSSASRSTSSGLAGLILTGGFLALTSSPPSVVVVVVLLLVVVEAVVMGAAGVVGVVRGSM